MARFAFNRNSTGLAVWSGLWPAAVLCLCAAAAAGQEQPESASGLQPARAASTAKVHMVAAANPLAARAGLQVLREGGSAADAAVAMQLVLTLVEPQSSGIGGGAFLLHWDGRSEEHTSELQSRRD